MKPTRIICFACLAAAISAGCVRADAVTDWNAFALAAIKTESSPPPKASRMLAILHVAIFDACNGISQRCEPYCAPGKPAGVASREAAIAAAAHRVLVALHPQLSSVFDLAYGDSLNAIADGPRAAGIEWGETAANAILQLRANDAAALTVTYAPAATTGSWIATPPNFAAALLPNWPLVTPFTLPDVLAFRPAAPPLLTSPAWVAAFEEVKLLGRIDSATRTPEQTAIARFWADGGGTVTPPGHWNVIARDVSRHFGLTLDENARLFALLNLAQADAAIAAWDAKYAYNFWRPITAIRNADADGNPATVADPTWTPLLATPPFPECVSGHSTFSGAAAAVLGLFFGRDDIAFTTTSEDVPGMTRAFASFSAAAEEAGMSRIYGGIHFSFSNRSGLDTGARIGRHAMANYLQAKPGNSHRGH